MTSDSATYARLRRAIETRNLAIIRSTAARLGTISLRDALGILLVIECSNGILRDAARQHLLAFTSTGGTPVSRLLETR